jgi:hypothetical protein
MFRLLSSVLLIGALGSVAGCAAEVTYYDGPRADYHRWNDTEERAYRAYLVEQGRPYVEFRKLEAGDRDRYWGWRHEHPHADQDDHSRDRDRDSGRH